MLCLAIALLTFFLFLGSHVLLFRLKIMQFQTGRFIGLMVIWFVVYGFLISRLESPEIALSGGLFYFLCCLWYLAQCTAIQVQSPSMTIIQKILDHPESEASYEELKALFHDREFIDARLEDLVLCGHVTCRDGVYYLSGRGAMIAKVIRVYRRCINQGVGG